MGCHKHVLIHSAWKGLALDKIVNLAMMSHGLLESWLLAPPSPVSILLNVS